MSWNAKVRCVRTKNNDLTLGKIYVVNDGSFTDDDGYEFGNGCPFTNIDDLNNKLISKFELVEDEKTCENCGNKTLSDKTETCNKCVSHKLPESLRPWLKPPLNVELPPSHWMPIETADTSKIDENNVTKSILLNVEDEKEWDSDTVPGIVGNVTDNINNPSHYNQYRVEVIDIIEDATKNLKGIEAVCVSNILKYILRYQFKNGIEDIKKCRWYIDKLIKAKGEI